MLDEEANEDGQMRNHFKERWSRTPSSKLTQQLRDEGEKYKNILSNATSADGIVKEKYNTHRRGMEILSKSDVCVCCCMLVVLFVSEDHKAGFPLGRLIGRSDCCFFCGFENEGF